MLIKKGEYLMSNIGFKDTDTEASRKGAYIFSVTLFIVATLVVIAPFAPNIAIWNIVLGVVVGVLVSSSIHIALEWEKFVILRFGKFNRVSGPGLCFTIPIVESITATIDQRMMATPFMAEQTLTADAVPINVDAVLFWMVWDPRKATMEVANYSVAVSWAAQTTMRDVIGRTTLAEMLAQRETLDHELQKIIDEKTEEWGITVVSVEIRDIVIPKELQDAMSKEAQAERERNARIILTKAEKDISEMFVEVSDIYKDNAVALQLRTMNLVYESVKDHGGMIVVPSSFSNALESVMEVTKTQSNK